MRIYFTMLSIAFFEMAGIGQNVFSAKDFLASAKFQENVTYQKQKFSFLNNISHELPLVEKLEVRTETNEFDWRKQEFLLRVSPNSRQAIKVQKQYQETNRHLAEIELEVAFNAAIKNRYDILVEYIYLHKILNLKEKQRVLFSDRLTLLQRSINLPDFDILELIDAEDEEQKIIREMMDSENKQLILKKDMEQKIATNKEFDLKNEQLISIMDLRAILNLVNPLSVTSHHELKLRSAKVYNSLMEYQWEAMETQFKLAYVQSKFGYDSNEGLGRSFSIGLGFDIPLKGAARLDLNELQIKNFELESDFRNTRTYLEEEKNNLFLEIENLLRKYDLVSAQLQNSQAEYALKEYSKIAEAAPIALLKMRENTLNKKVILQDLEFEIMKTYVDWLDITGLLTQKPYRNYLVRSLEGF